MKKGDLFLFSLSHFFVDLACGFLLYRALPGRGHFPEFLLLYNFLAFGMQMPLGLLLDRLGENGRAGALGALLTALAFPFWKFPFLCVLFLGLGNALFHAGGGLMVLNESREKLSPLGIFVSPGALGIFLGPLLGKGEALPLFGIALPLLLLAFLLRKKQSQNAPFSLDVSKGTLLPLLALFLVVVLRSFLGGSLDLPYKADYALLLCLSTVFGKAAGGILADRLGIKAASVLPPLFCALCFGLSKEPLFGIWGIFLFNMSMPLSLHLAAMRLRQLKGFAFGLLTFALFLGFVPSYYQLALPASPLLYGALALLSLPLLLYGGKEG